MQFITMVEAAARVPTCPHVSTIWRWCREGVKSRSGERIKLPHRRIGGRIFIDPDDLDGFFRRVAEADANYFDRDGDRRHKRGGRRKTTTANRSRDVLRERGVIR